MIGKHVQLLDGETYLLDEGRLSKHLGQEEIRNYLIKNSSGETTGKATLRTHMDTKNYQTTHVFTQWGANGDEILNKIIPDDEL